MEPDALIAMVTETVRNYRLGARGDETEVDAETLLFGPRGVLDSIGLVSVVVELEQQLSEREGRSVSLMHDRAMSLARSPFRTVRSLAEYMGSQLATKT